MADDEPPLSSKNEQHQPLISPEPTPRLQHALPPIAAPEYAELRTLIQHFARPVM
jgi:hypothetical protein